MTPSPWVYVSSVLSPPAVRSSPASGVVTVRFELPSAHSQTFQAKADVVWNDSFAMGLRFLRIEPACRQVFPSERSSDSSIRTPQRPLSNLPGKGRCSLE